MGGCKHPRLEKYLSPHIIMLNKIKLKLKEARFPYKHYMDRHQCIFIHIPKAAGTSINIALGKKSESGRLHLPWYVFQTANPKKFREYFKFAFVRNPWDRAYSAYSYLRQGGNGKDDLVYKDMLLSFKDFDDFIINGLGEGKFRNIPLFVPQIDVVLGFNQQLAVDFLGKFETLENDFKYVARKLKLNAALPRRNITNKHPEPIYKTNRAIEIISELYKQDIRIFDYQFNR